MRPSPSLWRNLINRTTPGNKACFGRYVGCSVSPLFKDEANFWQWCAKQVGFFAWEDSKPFQLDKDLLIKNNKVYSEDTCVFLPQRLNGFLLKRNASRGDLPVGVSWHTVTNKFQARCKGEDCRSVYLGLHDTPEAAFTAHKMCKEATAKLLARKYEGVIDSRAVEALLAYEVLITD